MRYGILLFLLAGIFAAEVTSRAFAGDAFIAPPWDFGFPDSAAEPNVPEEVVAEGVVAIEPLTPLVSVMTAATEAPAFSYRLMYRVGELSDGDFWALYTQFLAVDPNHPEREPDVSFLREQLALEPEAMDLGALGRHLEACGAKRMLLEQAVRCRSVVWPKIQPPPVVTHHRWNMRWSVPDVEPVVPEQPILKIADVPALLETVEAAGLLLAASARYHIARAEYAEACRWLRAGLAQGRQMTTETDAFLAAAGAVNTGRMLGQIEAWVQQPGSPSLFRALGDVRRPLISLGAMAELLRYTEAGSSDVLEIAPEILGYAPRIIQNLERLMAALQCVEAIRLHAALYEGQLPASLAEITDVRVPLDPVTRRPFLYERQERGFVVSSDGETGGQGVEVHYRIIREEPKTHWWL